MPGNDEYDWIFDFCLQFLESDKFDCSIMDFVDEKCFVFDDEEENKFIYTDVHKEFCEHVEALITSNLGELGITPEMFVEACERSRGTRDINNTVYERLVAMDDFQTFKKLMVKRNTELQLEALRTLHAKSAIASAKVTLKKDNSCKSDDSNVADDGQIDPDELLALKETQLSALENENIAEEELQELLFQSLIEMELLHRQEELEHAELERALSLSLAMEEDRISGMLQGMKIEDLVVSDSKADSKFASEHFKAAATTAKEMSTTVAPAEATSSSAPTTAADSKSSSSPKKKTYGISAPSESSSAPSTLPELKPLRPLRTEMKPLPSIAGGGGQDAQRTAEELLEKKKAVEDALKRSQEQLADQRRNEEDLRSKLNGIDPEEAERRARHLKEQRDLLIAKKKAERERKVQQEEERKRRLEAKGGNEIPAAVENILADAQSDSKRDENDEIAEMRRATLRMALARRLKMDLIESEEAKLAAVQESQFAEYDRKLQQVEQLREDNRRREYTLNKQLARQQEQIAKNIKLSAAALSQERDD